MLSQIINRNKGSIGGISMILVIILFSLIIAPTILFIYEKNEYSIEKEKILMATDVAIYNTYNLLKTKELSEQDFSYDTAILENEFKKNLKYNVENTSMFSKYEDISIVRFEYNSYDKCFYIEMDVVYLPIFSRVLGSKKILLSIEYEIPQNN